MCKIFVFVFFHKDNTRVRVGLNNFRSWELDKAKQNCKSLQAALNVSLESFLVFVRHSVVRGTACLLKSCSAKPEVQSIKE